MPTLGGVPLEDLAAIAVRRVELLESLAPIASELVHLAQREAQLRAQLPAAERQVVPSVAAVEADRAVTALARLSLVPFDR